MPNYTADYYIKKFTKIPASRWCIGAFTRLDGKKVLHCASGFCRGENDTPTEESAALGRLFCKYFGASAAHINDVRSSEFPEETPRARVVAALKHIKKLEGA